MRSGKRVNLLAADRTGSYLQTSSISYKVAMRGGVDLLSVHGSYPGHPPLVTLLETGVNQQLTELDENLLIKNKRHMIDLLKTS